MNVEKLSKTLLHLSKDVRLRLHVSFTEKDRVTRGKKLKKFHTIYTYSNKNYISMDFMSFMTLEIKGEEWDPSMSIMINQRNIYQVIHGLKRTLENIYLPDTFYIDSTDNQTKIFKDISVERTVRLYNIGSYQNMILVPAVVYEDAEDAEYEGAVMFINDSSNNFNITVSGLETLLYTLSKIDLFLYGYTMIDFYFNNIVNHIGPSFAGEEVTDYIMSARSNMFEEKYKESKKDATVSTLKKEVDDKDFFGI